MRSLLLITLILTIATIPFSNGVIIAEQSVDVRNNIMDKLMDISSPDLFIAYHLLFQKNYELESSEGIMRKGIFEQNVEFIKATNAKKLEYTLGINQFTDLTKEEFKKTYLTVKKEEIDKVAERESKNFLHYTEKFDSAPKIGVTNIDWTSYFRPAVNQGGCGSCWAFSVAGTIEGNLQVKNEKYNKAGLSPQYLVDCDKNGSYGCNGGNPSTAFDYIIKNGVPYENQYPYKGADQQCHSDAANNNFVVDKVEQCYNCTKDRLTTLLAKGPLSVVIDGEGNGVFQSYRSGIISMSCSEINHAVIMVGINANDAGQGYYIGRNSWGTGWGEQGNFRLQIDSAPQSCFLEYFGLLPVVRDPANPNPDPPAPKCAQIWTECDYSGVGYEICQNTPNVPTTITNSWEKGKFDRAMLFMDVRCNGGYYIIDSDWSCFAGYPVQNNVKSIVVGNDPVASSGCVRVYEESCFAGEYFEICSSTKTLGVWSNRIGSVAIGSGIINYKLYTSSNWVTTRSFHAYGLSSTFYKKINQIVINK